MPTVALEFVPPEQSHGAARALEEARKARDLLREAGLLDRVDTLLLPGMIPEDPDRPVPLRPRMDPLDTYLAVRDVLPLDAIATQVTAFSSAEELDGRIAALGEAGIRRAVFVGVPRTLADGQGPGLTPADALTRYRGRLAGCGVVFIPTRADEAARLRAKVQAGADFALCQLLFSDHVVRVVRELALDAPRPEILLSFGYVPKSEEKVGLIRWLIRDQTDAARREMEEVARVAGLPFAQKKAALVDVYRRVTDGLRDAGHPLGVHLECPYDFNPWAFEVFAAMLDHWAPPQPAPAPARGR